MAPSDFLPRVQWERRLRNSGAEPASDLTPLGSAEWWRAPGRGAFTVPVEHDGGAEVWAIRTLRKWLGESSAPSSPPNGDH
jgi:hypothetical protein